MKGQSRDCPSTPRRETQQLLSEEAGSSASTYCPTTNGTMTFTTAVPHPRSAGPGDADIMSEARVATLVRDDRLSVLGGSHERMKGPQSAEIEGR